MQMSANMAESLKSVVGVNRDSYRVSCTEDILRIPDMKTARNLLKDWHLETKGIKSKDDAVHRLLDYWNTTETKPKKQKFNALQQAIVEDRNNRKQLTEYYKKLLLYYQKLPKHHQVNLDGFAGGVETTAMEKQRELQSSDCTILITGETSAGKSSFVNLLLGTDILPTSDLRCTTTICEIRNAKDGRKFAVLHYKSEDKKKKKPEILELSEERGLKTLKIRLTEFDEETEESPYSRIEIYWPFSILEDGIVIVDTPGIGASRQMSKCVEKYLKKSFGFIYIINSANAGGVNKGRLRDFLKVVTTSIDDDFNPRASIFLCNKWDTVPEVDKQKVQEDTFTKLQNSYPGIREDQVFRISTEEAHKAAQYSGSVIEDYARVLEGIERLLPCSLRNQLSSHYRWISQVYKRALYALKVSKLMDAKGIQEKEELQKRLKKQMDLLDRNAKQALEDMKCGIMRETEILLRTSCDFLMTNETLEHICRWEPKDCPPVGNWKNVVKAAEEKIGKRISFEINMWDNDKNIVRGIKDRIVNKFKREFELMEDQMRDIEGTLLPGDSKAVSDFQKSMKRPVPVRQIFAKAGKEKKVGGKKVVQDNMTQRLGSAISSAGCLDTKAKDTRSIFKSSYNKGNAYIKMADATRAFIDSIVRGKTLKIKLDHFLGKYMKGIDDVTRMIPSILQADRKLMDTLNTEVSQAMGSLQNTYPSLIMDCERNQSELDMFYVVNLMEADFRVRDIKYDKRNSIGSGSFADVYKGQLKHSSISLDGLDVALKVSKQPLSTKNVTDILLEDKTLRDLNHTNIVTYYGTVLSQSGKPPKITWVMVMEFCQGTLKDKVLDEDYNNPGKFDSSQRELQIDAMKAMAKLNVDLCRGLAHLHSKELTHRDLKLENVLVAVDGTVKLTDVGLTKETDNISGTFVGSPVYMAPEVLTSKGIYGNSADIYSLAIMLWEMWYGMDAAVHIQHQVYKTLQDSVMGGLRPSLSLQHKPPDDWQAVIQRCWSLEPERRLEARLVGNFFQDFLSRL